MFDVDTADDGVAGVRGEGQDGGEGQLLEPACRDVEALLVSSQQRVTGNVFLQFRPGSLFVEGVSSPHSLRAATTSVYGEAPGEWTPADARGFAALRSLPPMLHARAGGAEEATS